MSERINQHLNPLIGSNIRRLRKEHHMKAVDVIAKLQCENINVTTGIFSKVENGYNNPTVDMLIALTKVFECILYQIEKNHQKILMNFLKNKRLFSDTDIKPLF